jgi:dihydrofolate synthase/folylpolyglutamate synthase
MSAPDYHQALTYWYRRVNYEQSLPQPGDLKLDRMRGLLDRLGNPHQRLRIVHVAGSKGKGSSAAMLATILNCAGYRTGLFTSPHLCDVSERMQVNGLPISRAELIQLLADVESAEKRLGVDCTFFEIATALAFLHFVRRRVELAVLEVGLGGRFDSTNVCVPLVSLITSISLDHTRELGDRLASIAMEKAGIVKPGRPVISAAIGPEARPVIEAICRERAAPLRQLDRDFSYAYAPGQVTPGACRRPTVSIRGQRVWPVMELRLLGEHQAANAAVVVACVEELNRLGLHIGDAAVARGLAEVDWPARLEVVGQRPMILLDCAHNVASAQALVDTLATAFPRGGNGKPGQRRLVFAASADKDVAGMLRVLAPHFQAFYFTRYTTNPRSADPEHLVDLLRRAGSVSDRSIGVYATPAEAWRQAQADAGDADLICITGSVFLAGELRPLIM